jgi:ribosomal protein S18 acetylase RimI-like enzyme
VGRLGLRTGPAVRRSGGPAVRRATAADLGAIVALEAACFPAVDRFPPRAWRRLLAPVCRHTALTLVCDGDDGALAGSVCLLLRRTARVVRIYSIAVAPAARGRGLGRLLLLAAVAALPRRITTLSLEVRADNGAALGLYCALGFVETHRLPRYYGDGADGVRLRCGRAALPPPPRVP